MNTQKFKTLLAKTAVDPQTIHGILQWCDRWCERCCKTEHCTVYKTSTDLPSDTPDDFFKSLSIVFEATMEMLKEYSKNMEIDFESLKDSDIENEYDKNKYLIHNGVTFIKLSKKMRTKYLVFLSVCSNWAITSNSDSLPHGSLCGKD